MDKEERAKLKRKYIQMINGHGYKIMHDLDPNMDNQMYDINMLCSRVDKDETICRKKYVFLQIPYTSPLSFNEYKTYLPGGKNEELLGMFNTGLKNRMLEYTIDDIVAILLHDGYHLEEIYQFVQGKPRLKLNPQIIERLVNDGNTKGSPLENKAMRMRAAQMSLKRAMR